MGISEGARLRPALTVPTLTLLPQASPLQWMAQEDGGEGLGQDAKAKLSDKTVPSGKCYPQ